MAIALQQSTKKVVTGVNNTTLAYGSALLAGSLLCNSMTCLNSGGSGITTPTDTLTHAYAGMIAEQSNGSTFFRSFYAENSSPGANTVTFDMGGTGSGDITVVIAEFTGAMTSGALGVTSSGSGTTTTGATSGTTTTLDQADGMLWGAITHTGNNTTIAEQGGATLVQENEGGTSNMPIGVSYELTTATPGQAATWNFGASRTYLAHVAFFKAAAGAGGRTTKNTRAFPLGTEIGMNWRGAA